MRASMFIAILRQHNGCLSEIVLRRTLIPNIIKEVMNHPR